MSEQNESDLAVWEKIVYTPTSSPPESLLANISEPCTTVEIPTDKSEALAGDKKAGKDKNEHCRDLTAGELKGTQQKDGIAIRPAKKRLPRVRLEPTVRECNWEQFKNHYSVQDATHAIDVLLAGDELDEQMEHEQLRRLSAKQRKRFVADQGRKPLQQSKDHQERLIKRVRINSPAVLSLISKVTGDDHCVTKPLTFLRPFKSLIHFQDKMEERFASLKARVGQPGELATGLTNVKHTSAAIEGVRAYEEVKAYIEFVKDRLLPIYHKFDKLDYTHEPKVRFSDLWYLFRYGEVVHQREDPEIDNRLSTSQKPTGQQLWRVYWIQRAATDWRAGDLKDENGKLCREDLPEPDEITISSYYIDFDGKSYAGVWRYFVIQQFEGEVDVTSLPIFPIRFQRGYENTLQYCRERGQRFRNLLSQQYVPVRHDGWTLTHKPSGYLLRDRLTDENKKANEDEEEKSQDDEDMKWREVSEYIDSDVIIDFEEAYKAHPSWKPQYATWRKSNLNTDTQEDKFAIIQWSGPDRSKVVQKTNEMVIAADDVGSLEWNRLADKDDFAIDESVRVTEKDPSKQTFSPDDIALLPARLMVYSLRHGRFVNVDIANIKELPANADDLGKLLIPLTESSVISAMMQDHCDHQDMQKKSQSTGTTRTPRVALKILLHGPSGVGKTTTAKALSAAHSKGLLTISCADLGTDIEMIEDKLLDNIRLAKKWNCLLLINETEILLSHQEQGHSLSRNALMSAVFRTVNKYQGIAFVEAEEDRNLIEALASKADVRVAFNTLSLDQTLALFKMKIKHYKEIARQRASDTDQSVQVFREEGILSFAQQSFERFSGHWGREPWWNGHQIDKAFQIAISLAYVEQKDATERYLEREHFEKVMSFIP
ncbi:Ff.00g014170.m01.CDS01 [Fusarium sp. VM40]|nr:Ff.00g014170.m01.CDS01 [Fusarium sp. VM40]